MAIGGKEFLLDSDDFYPSLRIDISVRSPDKEACRICNLKNVLIDTGSDFTLVPIRVIASLKLSPTGNEYELEPYDGKRRTKKVKFYSGRIVIDNILDELVELGAIDAEPLIGMDLINKCHMLVNGPFNRFEIANISSYLHPIS